MQDEAFHEIQLNGKQLVFLFMAATVVAVVIFLCGVMVGRGVPTQGVGEQAAISEASLDPTAFNSTALNSTALNSAAASAVAPSTEGIPIASKETLTYPGRLEDADPPAETLKAPAVARAEAFDPLPEPAAEPTVEPAKKTAAAVVAVPAAPVMPPVAKKPAVVTTAAAPVTAPVTRSAGSGFVVQVAAVRQRAEADTIARRLTGKGYPAFVTTPAGAANVFRVRVGAYPDRREAESVAGRLEKEEQFKPWVTR